MSGADTATRLDGRQGRKPNSNGVVERTKISSEFRETAHRMSKIPPADASPKSQPKLTRAERLAEVLRANLKRRKDAKRSRKGAEGSDERTSEEDDA